MSRYQALNLPYPSLTHVDGLDLLADPCTSLPTIYLLALLKAL